MEVVFRHWPDLLAGFWITTWVTAVTIILATMLGFVVFMLRLSTNPICRAFATVYIDAFQNTPYLIVVFIIYFGLPEVGLTFSAYTSAIGGLSLYSAAYLAEAFRSGYLAIPREQLQGAAACALRASTIFIHIIFPQATVYSIPAITNQWVRIALNSTVISILGGGDLLDQARNLAAVTFDVFPFYAIGAMGYWVLITPAASLVRRCERAPKWRRAQLGLPLRQGRGT